MLNTTRSKYLHKLTKSLKLYRDIEKTNTVESENLRGREFFFILRVPIYIEFIPHVHAVYNINVTLFSDQWSSEN